MQEDILEAALRVLAADGARRFTTTRVAEVAGISVGSLYQYYPNRASLLLALHEREVRTAWRHVEQILAATDLGPREQIARVVAFFFHAEADEPPPMRDLMNEVDAQLRDAASQQALQAEALRGITSFLRDAIPREQTAETLAFHTDLFFTLIESVGKRIASRGLNRDAVARWAHTCSDMLCDYLQLP